MYSARRHKKRYITNLYNMHVTIRDMIFSIIGIIISIPILIIVGVLIKLEDGGPIFYTQQRIGKDEKEFTIYKLRTMKIDADKHGNIWASKNDSRITKIGKVIRKTRIDELPQFLNIMKGDMSLIGPRPEVLDLTLKFNEEIEGFIKRVKIKPGITGWAQVNGGYDLTPKEKYEKDMYYIKNRGFKLDILIILKTINVIIFGHGAR